MTVFTLRSTKVYTECDASQPPTLRQKLTSAWWSQALHEMPENLGHYVKMPDYIDCL